MSRITNTTTSRAVLANIQNTARSLADAQDKISSGKQVRKPSDGPAQVLTALDHRSQIRRNEQLGRNVLDARSWLDNADSALTHSVTEMTRARTLVVNGVNGATDAQGRFALASEIRTIAEGLVQTANTKHLGRPIFGGTTGGDIAYDASGSYQGDQGKIARTIAPSVTVQVNRSGPEVFGTEDAGDPMNGNAFQMLNAVADALEAGDIETARSGLDAIDAATARIERAQVEMGARAKQLDEVHIRNEDVAIELKSALAEVEDTDMVEAIITLQAQEMAYQGALAVTAKVVQPTLLDFLR
ncbi:MAG: flagellar hook-associated protein FlgL [Acidimicrobiales bacterium]|nr:flagellar hook-associated protein FlgL [Acidimicrobiales bacterium]